MRMERKFNQEVRYQETLVQKLHREVNEKKKTLNKKEQETVEEASLFVNILGVIAIFVCVFSIMGIVTMAN